MVVFINQFFHYYLMTTKTATKSIKDMTPKEIIAGVKTGEIDSCHYDSNAKYLLAMNEK